MRSSASTTRTKGIPAALFTSSTKAALGASNRHITCASPGNTTARQRGAALLAVLLLLVLVAGASATFIWVMNQQQTTAGTRLRARAALAVAEAGVHRALSALESTAPDGRTPGRLWRSSAYSELVAAGAIAGEFTISIEDDPGGGIQITSTGRVGGVARRLRARVELASPALLAALYGTAVVHLERPPAAIVLLPYGAGIGDRPWIQIAAGRGIVFATADVSINYATQTVETSPGPVDGLDAARGPTAPQRPGPIRLLLAREASLTVGNERRRVNVEQLRTMGIHVDGVVVHSQALPALPEVDRASYQRLAAANTANAGLNEAAGRHAGNDALARKRDSLYEHVEFEQVMAYLRTGRQSAALRGLVYLRGGLSLAEDQRLQIVDGGLVAESAIYLDRGGALEVTHGAATRTLPGLIILDDGALVVTRQARLRVHGLVYVNRVIELGVGAHVDVVGAVLGNDPEMSFRTYAASVVIRYDPAVLGTPGLRVPAGSPLATWVAKWEELP